MLAEADKNAAALLRRLAAADGPYGPPRASLAAYPVLTGADFAAEVEAHPPFGRYQLAAEPFIRTALTTSAVPRPTPTAWTRADLDTEAELGARALRRTGLGPRTRSSDCLEGGLVTPGTLAVSDALDALDALALPVGRLTAEANLQRAAEVWEIVRPDVLIVDAPSLLFLRSNSGYPAPRAFAALLTPADATQLTAPPAADVYRIFSLPQVGTFIAGECSAHNGFHLAEDAVLAEIVDDRGTAVPDGTVGRLLLTTLIRSLTLLRCDSSVHAMLDRAPCSCGDTHARLRF
jgi:phenylacetate-CoA ligase